MGVPLLLTWLRRRFTSCFLPATGTVSQHVRNPDNLYVDLNSLLYQSAQIMTSSGSSFRHAEELENAILQKLFDLLDDLIFEVCGEPQRLIYLAVDGVSPLGKLSQQRARRSRARRTRRHYGNRGNGPDIESLWDSNCISVGTRFMEKVTEALHHYAVTRTERVNCKRFASAQEGLRSNPGSEVTTAAKTELVPLAIVVDDVLRPGEGENKITEAIRRFRSHPQYNPNTSHIICSSDTDVTVSCLILHEPRIHVLRYEPSSMVASRTRHNAYNNNHNNNSNNNNGSQQQGGPMADTWNSTFFSIHQFRHDLRDVLGLQHLPVESGSVVGVQYNEEKDAQFEKTLHDVVFVMLLFGNDFLPECGGSIQEGTLDGLLTILANDFVSRGRTIVNPETNQILFESARFLLDCLYDIRGERRRGGGGGGGHFAGGGCGDVIGVNNSGGGEPAMQWGFEDDEAFQEKQAKKEKQLEMKCYCYWTMLQWALQYSAGIVEHWGCYYPFSDAPPLQALQKYCGVLSYEALMSFALNFRHAHAAASAETATAVSPTVPSAKTYDNAPPDVLVQLLILLPSRSVALLPSAIRPAFAEVEPLVQAPMEKLDFVAIRNWCQQKRSHLTEVERTRFLAYEVFAQATCLSECKERITGQMARFTASDLVFAALWNRDKAQEELKKAQERLVEQAKKASAPATAAPPPSPSALMASGSKGASFFGAKKVGGPSSAAAALLQSAKLAPPPPPPPPAPVVATSAIAEEIQMNPATVSTTASAATIPQSEKCVETSFNFNLAPLSILPGVQLAKSLGYIDGARFTMVATTTADGSDPSHFLSAIDPMGGKRDLSRDTLTQHVRLQWMLACVPIECTADVVRLNAARLLPGYTEPGHHQTFKEAVDAGRASLLDATVGTGDVWKNAKRPREDDASSSGDDDAMNDSNKKTESEAEALSNTTSTAADDLEKRKEEMRKRLAALKQGLNNA